MTDSSQENRLYTYTKHPLVILLAGTLLGSVLIPSVNRRIAQEQRLEDLKAERAVQLLKFSGTVDRQLNLLLTVFESFHKDNAVTEPEDIEQAARLQLQRRVNELYEEFDRVAWWSHGQILQEAQVLGLLEERETAQVAQAADKYSKNLVAATQEVDRLWDALIRHPDSLEREQLSLLFEKVRGASQELQAERQRVITTLVQSLRD